MQKEELLKAFAYANMLWSTFNLPTDRNKKILLTQIWYDALKPYPLELVYSAMREHARKSDFVNIMKIAEECRAIENLAKNECLNENEILLEIEKAVCSGNQIKAFNELSDIAKKVVGSPSKLASWGQCSVEIYNSVIESNLRKAIKEQIKNFEKIENVFGNRLEFEQTKLIARNGED